MIANDTIVQAYQEYIDHKDFVCIAAKAALAHQQIHCFVANHMACPNDDQEILEFLYRFIDEFRKGNPLYHSAAVIFRGPEEINEAGFDLFLWQRLQALLNLDRMKYGNDPRVSEDPANPNFSFSLKEEAFFLIGLHPQSSRQTRRFAYPAIAFNPHAQFELLRQTNRYQRMQQVVRRRDVALSGSINPMLENFGDASETFQYSGMAHDSSWKCPLNIQHANKHNSAA